MYNGQRGPWSVGKRVGVLCVALFTLSVMTSIVSVISVRVLVGSLSGIATKSVPSNESITAIQALGLEFRGTSLLMGNAGLSDTYRRAQMAHLGELRTEILHRLDLYGKSIPQQQTETYQELKSATGTFVSAIDHFLDLASSGKAEEAGAFWSKSGSLCSKTFRAALEHNVRLSQRLNDSYLKSGLTAAHWAWVLAWFLFAASGATGIIASLSFVRGITKVLSAATRELRATVDEVISASGQVASSSNQLAGNSTQQAAALEKAADSGKEASSATERNALNCQRASQLILQTEKSVHQTNRTLNDALVAMKDITESSDRITTVIKAIEGIAFQTNILALNAAVEAARAGAAGMGFAVVADEVKTLAGRCSTAAQDATSLIGGSVEKTRSGKTQLDEVAGSVRDMASNALQMKDLVENMDREAQLQSRSFELIANALSSIEQNNHETAAMAEESAAASTELNAQANSLGQIINSLEALV